MMLNRCVELVNQSGITPVIEEGGTFAENCNRGAIGRESDILVFLNDDCEPQDGWLTGLLTLFQDETVGITGARLLYPDGTLQHGGIRLTADPGWNAHNITEEPSDWPIHAVTGACLAIRRDLFNQLGGFHEGYRNGAEDVDLCLKAWQAGYKVVYCPESVVIHHESQSGPLRWKWVNENVQLFRSRWAFSVGVAWIGNDDSSTNS